MKYIVAVALLVVGMCAVANANNPKEQYCYNNAVVPICDKKKNFEGSVCNATFGAINEIQSHVQNYISLQLQKSFDYLFLATHFNSYQKNRPGFQKLYQGLSDRSFDDTIDLIKHLTKRGGIAKFDMVHDRSQALEVDELHSLALALDTEKQLAHGAVHVHTHATHLLKRDNSGEERRYHDPELAHYIEENFLGKQADSVRKLSGYANDLSKLMAVEDPSLSIYLFDEYLQKQ